MSRATATVPREGEKQEQGPQAVRTYGGLCRDCPKADSCTFPRDPAREVRFCDEFDVPSITPVRPVAPVIGPMARVTESAESADFRGLCRHCARRFTCTFPKPAGGVWHCDELA